VRQYLIRIKPPNLFIKQRASNPELAVRAAVHFHGDEWRKAVRQGMGTISCSEVACGATYDRIIFTPELRHNGRRTYRADPFPMIRAGEKTTTVRRSKAYNGDPSDPVPAHEVGDLLEAAQGGMRSGAIIEIIDVPEWDAEAITPEMAYNDGFTGDAAGAALMSSLVASEGGPMDLYVFRYRADLSFVPYDLKSGHAAGQSGVQP